MLRVPLQTARPGMVLAMPVFHPRRQETALLASGIALDARTIRRLREIRLAEVYVRYPPLEFVAGYLDPRIAAAHAGVAHSVAHAFDALAADAHARLDYPRYKRAVSSLLDALLGNTPAAIFVQEMVDRDHPALRHATTVCYLSLLMGLKLDGYLISQRARLRAAAARDVTSLGLGGLLHDVGMLRLDPAVVERWERTGDDDDPEWREHVHIGYDMVRGNVGPAAAAAVLHHHQAWDGSGFPRRTTLDGHARAVAGDRIHVFARIVAAADVFDRVRHAGGVEAPAVRALRLVREHHVGTRLDPMVFKALLAVVPAYAPGTIVTLSDGQRAVVTEWFPDDPCRPTVHASEDLDAGFSDADPRLVRVALREHPSLSIVQADGHDVSRDNFHATTPGEFDLVLAERKLFNKALERDEDRPQRRAG